MAQLVKTVGGLAIASCKTVGGLAIASVKTIGGLDNTGGVTPIAPDAITGLQIWGQADDVSGSDGDPISTWTDKSGNGNDLSASLSTRPTLQVAEVNGHKILRFDGVLSLMQTNAVDVAVTWGITNVFTSFFAIKASGGAGTLRPYYSWISPVTTNEFSLWYAYSDDNAYVTCGNQAGTGFASGPITANTNWKVVVVQRNAGTVDIWEDGVNVLHATGLSDGLDTGSVTFNLLNIGASVCAADLEEFGIYNTAISSGDRAGLEAYLSNRVL